MRMLPPEGGQKNVRKNHNKGSMDTQCKQSHALVRKAPDEFIGLATLVVIDQSGTSQQSYAIVIEHGKISLGRAAGVTPTASSPLPFGVQSIRLTGLGTARLAGVAGPCRSGPPGRWDTNPWRSLTSRGKYSITDSDKAS